MPGFTNPLPPRSAQGYSEPEYTVPGSGLPRRLPAPQAPPNPNYTVKGVQPAKEYVASGGNVFIAEYVRALPHWIDDLSRDVGSDIYERMLLDYQCFSCLRSIILQALSDGVELHPAIKDKDDPDYEAAKAWLTYGQYVLDNLPVTLELWLREMLLGCALGHRLAEQTYIPCEDGKVVDLPIFAGRGPREPWMIGALKTKPRRCYSWVQDVYANTVGVIGLVPGQTAPVFTGALITAVGELPNVIPRSKFVAFVHDPWYADPRGTSLYRAAYRPWWEKTQTGGEYLKCLSRFGSPSLIGTTAEGAMAEAPTDGNGNVTGAVLSPEQKMLNMLTQFFNGSVCAVPYGSSVQVVWPGAGAGDAFLNRIRLADDQIAKAITMQTLASEQATHQARAAAEVHQETGEPGPRYLKILVVDMLYRDLLVPLVRANGGAGAVRLCPRPTLSPIPSSDRWTAVQAAAGAGYHLDDSQLPALDEQLGMPPREVQQPDQQGQDGEQGDGGVESYQKQVEGDEGDDGDGGNGAGFAAQWDELKHRRGQPGNRGEFGPGGGGVVTKPGQKPQQGAAGGNLHPLARRAMEGVVAALKGSSLDVATRKRYVQAAYDQFKGMSPDALKKYNARAPEHLATLLGQSKDKKSGGQEGAGKTEGAPGVGGIIREDADYINRQDKRLNNLVDVLPVKSMKALQKYTRKWDRRLNGPLRDGKPLEGKAAELAARIDVAMAQIPPLTDPVDTYRGINLAPEQKQQFLADCLKAAHKGEAISMPAYTSTTLNPTSAHFFAQTGGKGHAGGGVLFKIKARHGAYLDYLSEFPGEQEFLLPRGARFKVHAVEQTEFHETSATRHPVTVVHLEQL